METVSSETTETSTEKRQFKSRPNDRPGFVFPKWFPKVPVTQNRHDRLNVRGYQHVLPEQGVNYFTPEMAQDNFWALSDPPCREGGQSSHWQRSPNSRESQDVDHNLSSRSPDSRDNDLSSDMMPESQIRNLHKLCIGIAIYNEDPFELRRTLVSIADEAARLAAIAETHVVLVTDGHEQMNKETRLYLKRLFCNYDKNKEAHFDEVFHSLDRYVTEKKSADEDERNGIRMNRRKKMPPPLTYVIQRVVDEEVADIPIYGAKDGHIGRLRLTLVVKSLNRRKHNSQEWMFEFAHYHRPDYVFLTDCGTLFGQGCILRLVAYMIDNPSCVGCTGRQRVMSAEDQDMPDEGIVERFLRLVQTADYESSYATYTGAFSLIGFLPVLPGPCCMMRYSALKSVRMLRSPDPLLNILYGSSMQDGSTREQGETVLEHFTRLISTLPQETDLTIANVRLAEDRIPSYCLVLYGLRGAYTAWVDTPFYFQSESSVEPLAKQRRRWINGALFGYVWLTIVSPNLILKSRHNVFRRFLIWLFCLMQLMGYGLAIISPAIFASGLYLGLISLFGLDYVNYTIAATVVYSVLVWVFVWVHHKNERFDNSFVKILFFFMILANMIVVIVTISGYIRQAVAWDFSPQGVDRIILQWMIIFILSVPFVMAIISGNFLSLWLLIKCAIPYTLFLPTLVSSFTLYSMARLSDTTWGNRATTAGSDFKAATQLEIANCQQRLWQSAIMALITITIINGFVEFFVIYYGFVSWFIIAVLATIFAGTVIQSSVSIIYFIGKHLSGMTCWQRCGCCLCFRRRLDYS